MDMIQDSGTPLDLYDNNKNTTSLKQYTSVILPQKNNPLALKNMSKTSDSNNTSQSYKLVVVGKSMVKSQRGSV
jgi:hypothetical protein